MGWLLVRIIGTTTVVLPQLVRETINDTPDSSRLCPVIPK